MKLVDLHLHKSDQYTKFRLAPITGVRFPLYMIHIFMYTVIVNLRFNFKKLINNMTLVFKSARR